MNFVEPDHLRQLRNTLGLVVENKNAQQRSCIVGQEQSRPAQNLPQAGRVGPAFLQQNCNDRSQFSWPLGLRTSNACGPRVHQHDASREVPEEVFQKMSKQGWLGWLIDEKRWGIEATLDAGRSNYKVSPNGEMPISALY